MATVTILSPVSEDAETRKKEAQHHFSIIKKAGELVRVNSLRIGFHAAALKRGNLFGILGFESERDAMEAAGVKDSTWYNVVRIADAYPGVSEELFTAMKLTNAEALMDLPESKRFTEYWLRRAATDSIDLFRAMIEEELDGNAKPSAGRERVVPFTVKMPKSRREVVQAGLLEYAKSAGCAGDESKALEILVSEHREGPSLVGVLRETIESIGRIKEIEASDLSAAEIIERIDEELEETVSNIRTALEQLQNLGDE